MSLLLRAASSSSQYAVHSVEVSIAVDRSLPAAAAFSDKPTRIFATCSYALVEPTKVARAVHTAALGCAFVAPVQGARCTDGASTDGQQRRIRDLRVSKSGQTVENEQSRSSLTSACRTLETRHRDSARHFATSVIQYQYGGSVRRAQLGRSLPTALTTQRWHSAPLATRADSKPCGCHVEIKLGAFEGS